MDGWQKNDRFFPMDGDESYLEDAPALNARISFQRPEQAPQPAEKPAMQPRAGQPFGQSPLRNPLTPPKPLMPGMPYGQPTPAYSQPPADFYPQQPPVFGSSGGASPIAPPAQEPAMMPPTGYANPYSSEPAGFQSASVPIWSLSNNAEAPQTPFTAPLSKPAPLTAPLMDLKMPDFPEQPADVVPDGTATEDPAQTSAGRSDAVFPQAAPANDDPLQIPTYLRRKPVEPLKPADEASEAEAPSQADAAFDYHDPYKRPEADDAAAKADPSDAALAPMHASDETPATVPDVATAPESSEATPAATVLATEETPSPAEAPAAEVRQSRRARRRQAQENALKEDAQHEEASQPVRRRANRAKAANQPAPVALPKDAEPLPSPEPATAEPVAPVSVPDAPAPAQPVDETPAPSVPFFMEEVPAPVAPVTFPIFSNPIQPDDADTGIRWTENPHMNQAVPEGFLSGGMMTEALWHSPEAAIFNPNAMPTPGIGVPYGQNLPTPDQDHAAGQPAAPEILFPPEEITPSAPFYHEDVRSGSSGRMDTSSQRNDPLAGMPDIPLPPDTLDDVFASRPTRPQPINSFASTAGRASASTAVVQQTTGSSGSWQTAQPSQSSTGRNESSVPFVPQRHQTGSAAAAPNEKADPVKHTGTHAAPRKSPMASVRKHIKVIRWLVLGVMALLAVILGMKLLNDYVRNDEENRQADQLYYLQHGVSISDAGVPVQLPPEGVTFEPTAAPTPYYATPTPAPLGEEDAQSQQAEPTITPVRRTKQLTYANNELRNVLSDLSEDYKAYPDLVGKLVIPGLLDEYVVQGSNNTFYLTHNYRGTLQSGGAVFMDQANTLALPPENLHLRGNADVAGAVFHPLWQYRDGGAEFVKAHNKATMTTLYDKTNYMLLAVIETRQDPSAPNYFNYASHPTFETDQKMLDYVASAKQRSLYQLPMEVNPATRLLTLSTVSGNQNDLCLVLIFASVQ